jgi:hypothetical protein
MRAMFELDHIFVLCEPGAPEADALVAAGLIEGQSCVHQGQGTSNRLFFFPDFYLEFLWVHDEAEVRSSRTAPTQLWERWSQRQRGASSFGVCLRPAQAQFAEQKPFAGFDYRPAYFAPPYSIWLAEQQAIAAPLMFYLSFVSAPKQSLPAALLNAPSTVDVLFEFVRGSVLNVAHWPSNVQLLAGESEKMTLILDGAERELRFTDLPLQIRY